MLNLNRKVGLPTWLLNAFNEVVNMLIKALTQKTENSTSCEDKECQGKNLFHFNRAN
jgi:hypothetical protein